MRVLEANGSGLKPVWHLGKPSLPRRAVVLSLAALAAPVIASVVVPYGIKDYEQLVWLLLLVPTFLLGYFVGWRGILTAIAVGLSLFVAVQAGLAFYGYRAPSVPLLLGVAISYVVVSLGIGMLTDRMHAERMRAEEMALTDELTGLPNRRHTRLMLDREFAAARRGRPLVVVFFDIDRFKQYNDRHGHAAGDQALRGVAESLTSQTRAMNISGRWGGEEFLAVLSSAEIAGALVFVERVRTHLRELRLAGDSLTMSCGLAAYQPSMRTAEDLLAAADVALYEAKEAGSDSLRVYQPPLSASA